jgi:hypothetical protein
LTPAIVVNRTSTAEADGAKAAIATTLTSPATTERIRETELYEPE